MYLVSTQLLTINALQCIVFCYTQSNRLSIRLIYVTGAHERDSSPF